MTPEQIKQIVEDSINEVMVSLIVERVIEKLRGEYKKALVVFTGSLIGFDNTMEQLGRLKSEGFTFSVCLTDNAKKLLNLEKIKDTLKPEAIFDESSSLMPEQIALGFQTIIVPALSMNSAAKLANCISDTLATRVISNSIMRGKNVIIAVNGCCPDNAERALKGYNISPAHKEQLRANMERLRSYGATLTVIENLYEKTNRAINKLFFQGSASASPVEQSNLSVRGAQGEAEISGKVIGRTDILQYKNYKSIKIRKDALVTQFAAEAAQNFNIQLIRGV